MEVYTIKIEVADTPASEEWLGQFRAWLEVTPPGVQTTWRQQLDPETQGQGYVGIDDLVTFFEGWVERGEIKQKRLWYNARMVWLYLLLEPRVRQHLEVICADCTLDWEDCDCPGRKKILTTERWRLYPSTDYGQRFWLMGRLSLFALEPDDLPRDTSEVRRTRLLAFLEHLKGE